MTGMGRASARTAQTATAVGELLTQVREIEGIVQRMRALDAAELRDPTLPTARLRRVLILELYRAVHAPAGAP